MNKSDGDIAESIRKSISGVSFGIKPEKFSSQEEAVIWGRCGVGNIFEFVVTLSTIYFFSGDIVDSFKIESVRNVRIKKDVKSGIVAIVLDVNGLEEILFIEDSKLKNAFLLVLNRLLALHRRKDYGDRRN